MTAESDDAVERRRRVRLDIAYRGTPFRGSAPNPGVRTVLGVVAAAIERVCSEPVELTGAGRTDAGVHASAQVVTFDLVHPIAPDDLAHRLNRICGPDIAVRAARIVADDFDARFSATWRQYRYQVWNGTAPHPLLHEVAWHVPSALDVATMHEAAQHMVGEHDFSSLCRRPDGDPAVSLVRIVHTAIWRRPNDGDLLWFEVRGSAFCQQMVRSMVGTCVDVGLGRMAADAIPAVLAARDRAAAGRVAPPHGLTLTGVGYDGERWDAHGP